MITKYIDMSLMGTSGTGTTGDPYSYLEFKSYAENEGNWTDDHDFRFRNRGYVHTTSANMLYIELTTPDLNYSVTFESDDPSDPAVLRFDWSGPADSLIQMGRAGTWSSNVTVRNLIIECIGNVSYTLATWDDDQGPSLIIENNSFYVGAGDAGNIGYTGIESGRDMSIVGNTFIFLGNSPCHIHRFGNTGSSQLLVSSNYFEGNVTNCIQLDTAFNDVISGNVRNNYVYNNSTLSNIVSIPGTQSGLIVSGNVNNSGTGSQFISYTGNYSGTHSVLIPQFGSALIDGGYAEAGWITDIFGQDRGLEPDVGAAEYVATPAPVTPPGHTIVGMRTMGRTIDPDKKEISDRIPIPKEFFV